eukprot:scaffold34412_cov81-Phaeocystis_antarctica.AAC.1
MRPDSAPAHVTRPAQLPACVHRPWTIYGQLQRRRPSTAPTQQPVSRPRSSRAHAPACLAPAAKVKVRVRVRVRGWGPACQLPWSAVRYGVRCGV